MYRTVPYGSSSSSNPTSPLGVGGLDAIFVRYQLLHLTSLTDRCEINFDLRVWPHLTPSMPPHPLPAPTIHFTPQFYFPGQLSPTPNLHSPSLGTSHVEGRETLDSRQFKSVNAGIPQRAKGLAEVPNRCAFQQGHPIYILFPPLAAHPVTDPPPACSWYVAHVPATWLEHQ